MTPSSASGGRYSHVTESSGVIPSRIFPSRKEPPQRKRVLVVDDESSIGSGLVELLTIAGCEVIFATGWIEATRLWREGGADLIILDLSAPEKEGIETIIDLRAYSPGIPIIAMSGGEANNQLDLLQAAGLLGAVATIEKFFDKEAMMALVARCLVESDSRVGRQS